MMKPNPRVHPLPSDIIVADATLISVVGKVMKWPLFGFATVNVYALSVMTTCGAIFIALNNGTEEIYHA